MSEVYNHFKHRTKWLHRISNIVWTLHGELQLANHRAALISSSLRVDSWKLGQGYVASPAYSHAVYQHGFTDKPKEFFGCRSVDIYTKVFFHF